MHFQVYKNFEPEIAGNVSADFYFNGDKLNNISYYDSGDAVI